MNPKHLCPDCGGACNFKRKTESAVKQIKAAKPAKKHKYNRASVEKRTYNGIVYDGELEARVAAWLDFRLRKEGHNGGDILKWERQIEFPLKAHAPVIEKCEISKIVIDFKVEYVDRRVEYLEVKAWRRGRKLKRGGYGKGKPFMTPDFRLKWKILQANMPELFDGKGNEQVRVVTQKDLPHGI